MPAPCTITRRYLSVVWSLCSRIASTVSVWLMLGDTINYNKEKTVNWRTGELEWRNRIPDFSVLSDEKHFVNLVLKKVLYE